MVWGQIALAASTAVLGQLGKAKSAKTTQVRERDVRIDTKDKTSDVRSAVSVSPPSVDSLQRKHERYLTGLTGKKINPRYGTWSV
tara:strand:+ start:15562 stop:15816 length:255 start_codon:yes stop_codon:yes gene_type:complete